MLLPTEWHLRDPASPRLGRRHRTRAARPFARCFLQPGGIPEYHRAEGSNGRTVWRLEFDGVSRALAMQDRANAILSAGALTGSLIAEDSPLTFHVDGAGSDESTVRLFF